MSRRQLNVALGPVLTAVLTQPDHGQGTAAVLDATRELLLVHGLRGWTMADVADVAGVGRTTVYRQYPNRDDLVHGVLARELRDVLALIADVTSRQNTIEDKIVAAAVACLQALEESVVQRLLCTDPATFLPFLTTEAGPLLAIARDSLAAQIRAVEPKTTRQEAAEIAEAAARLGLSFVLTPQTIVPLDDPAATTASLRRIVGPLLVRAHTADDRTPA